MKYLKSIIIVFLWLVACNQVPPTPITSVQTNTMVSTPVSTPTAPDAASTIEVTPTAAEVSQTTPITAPKKLLKFSGQVSRGQVFEYEISGDFVFRLEPYEYGWNIWIGDKTEPLKDYVAVVTPPYRGMNARFIEGWHFRNSDNSGPNEPGTKSVNAPQKERKFYFVLNETDHQIAYNWLNDQLLSSDEEREQARVKHDQLEPQEGVLTITNLNLGNLTVGELAWIESMEFEVELSLPSDF